MAPQDVSGHADLLDNGLDNGFDNGSQGEGDQAEIKAQDDAALLVRPDNPVAQCTGQNLANRTFQRTMGYKPVCRPV